MPTHCFGVNPIPTRAPSICTWLKNQTVKSDNEIGKFFYLDMECHSCGLGQSILDILEYFHLQDIFWWNQKAKYQGTI